MRVDVVGEREQRFLEAGVPLHRDLDVADVARVLDEHDLLAERVLRLRVQVLDEVDDAAVVLEAVLDALSALVLEVDPEAPREEGHLAEALLEGLVVEVQLLEDLEVGEERDLSAALVGLRALLEGSLRDAALVALGPLVAVAPDLQPELLRQRVHDRHADAVEAAGDLVAAAVAELAAGVQDGEDDLGRGLALLLHDVDRDAATVVGHGD